jgi:hypothetical protein
MKKIAHKLFILLALFAGIYQVAAQGTAFTYNGRLNNTLGPVTGTYDVTFTLFTNSTGTLIQAGPITNSAIAVTNGLFLTLVDFGPGVFTNKIVWLGIGVRTNGTGSFTSLTPLQQITPTPYAIYAENAATLGGQSGTAYVAKAGDTMTGTLNLPANGLTVGGNQLVASGGNIGIGTANPSSRGTLTVDGGSGNNPIYLLASGTSEDQWAIGPAVGPQVGFGIYDYTAQATRIKINNNGNVGIGTTSPQNQLEVQLAHASSNQSVPTSAVKGIFSPSGAFGALAYTTTNPPVVVQIRNKTSKQPKNVNTSTLTYGVYGYGANGDYAGLFDGNVLVDGNAQISDGNLNVYGTAFIESTVTLGDGAGSSQVNPLVINGYGNTTDGGPGPYIPNNEAVLTSGDGFHNGFMSTYGNSAVTMDMFNGEYGEISTYIYGTGATLPLVLNVNGGNVGIGTTSPDAKLSVNGSADKPGGGSWTTFSDGRLKDVGASFTHGLEALKDIQPVLYHYKSDNSLKLPSQPEYVGVVAQQVQRVIPEAVAKSDSGYLTVNNDPIIWTMVNAIKELKAQNDDLKQRLEFLENKNSTQTTTQP